jgi:hypothetical protein
VTVAGRAPQPAPWVVKLERAQEHVIALNNEIGAYLRASLDMDSLPRPAEPGKWDLFFRQSSEPPSRWSACIGDVLHNVRSALDSFAFATITDRVSLNSQERRSIYFPITLTPAEFDNANWPSVKMGADLADAFRVVQPWYSFWSHTGLDQKKRERLIAADTLARLSRWSNTDKHRTLHVTTAVLPTFWAGLPPGAQAVWEWGDPWPWSDGSKIGTYTVTGLQPGQGPGFGDSFAVAVDEDANRQTAHGLPDRLGGFVMSAKIAIGRVQAALP